MFYIYILQSKISCHFYCGYSANPWRRLIEHNTKPYNAYTSKYRPWTLAAVFESGELEREAIRLEKFIKMQKSRKLIQKLVDPCFIPTGHLAQLVRVPHMRD